MKTRTKKFLTFGSIILCGVFGLGAIGVWCIKHYVHRHCIKQADGALRIYSSEHFGQFPFSTNGFGDALLVLAKEDPTVINCICGPDDDGQIFTAALTNNTEVPEEKCSRVYIQGLRETNGSEICILFDRKSCKGGDHGRSPWGHPLREAILIDGSMQIIRDEDWPEFSRKQVDLLVVAGFARTNALHFYPAAK